ncbi:hypothetical protein [Caviibacterium pharyngocola]|uniref:Uncharacterized protein n=1 Tax=Caviibacterium pharyngocola TaxID=28159 RepID=A0A2M8RUP4_9PAST|nr:hypothetical protein [Caviibacterium pharyngocola]PJG82616.1 hypothetical protein CVP04_08340 [Caviibacterium pharyngocola]
MKSTNIYLFDVSAIMQDNKTTDSAAPFVSGFTELLAKIGTDNLKILVSAEDAHNLPYIEQQLAKLNISHQIGILQCEQDIARYVDLSYQRNRFLFLNRMSAKKQDFRKPTAIILVDKNDDLLPEPNCAYIRNYNEIKRLF